MTDAEIPMKHILDTRWTCDECCQVKTLLNGSVEYTPTESAPRRKICTLCYAKMQPDPVLVSDLTPEVIVFLRDEQISNLKAKMQRIRDFLIEIEKVFEGIHLLRPVSARLRECIEELTPLDLRPGAVGRIISGVAFKPAEKKP